MKNNKFKGIAIFIAFACISVSYTPAVAVEPQRQNVHKIFSEQKEAKIQAIKSLTTKEVFDNLQSTDFMLNSDLSYKAIYEAFTSRRAEALSFAQSYLMSPSIEVVDGRQVTHGKSLNIAKKVFKVFPDEATPILVSLYYGSDDVVRGNVINVAGGVSGGAQIKDMLINALNDKSFAEEVTPELSGEPLRVCDIAYNQIVLRSGVRNVLRTIGSSHKIKTRDYHINELRLSLGNL